MAPPPSASLPLQQRLLQLAQTLQFAWFVGHLTLLACIARYSISYLTFNYYSRWARYSYRTAFLSAGVTYGIVVYKALKAKSRAGSKASQQSYTALLGDENVQYLAMAMIWLFSEQYPLAMLPFGVYSVFHVATYTRTNLIPTIQPPTPVAGAPATSPGGKPAVKNSPIADGIGKFVKEYYDLSMGLVAGLEIALWGRLLMSAILFTKGSWILIVIYTAFLRARFAQSSFVQNSFRMLTARIDALVGGQGNPPFVRQGWETAKGFGRQFHDATELGKYVNGGTPVKKTS
eukprot:GHVU01231381.1.p1 GENE.GHVU01231381.1~~GHVU01231381.1.p1  ORF type:complete len:316 (-),score=39.77 GHVU01231381.1:139-1005(-)